MMTPRSAVTNSPVTGSVAAMAAAASRSTLKVPTRLIWMTLLKLSSGSTPSRPSTLPGVATPAQFTTTRSGPSSVAAFDGGLHLLLVGDVRGGKDRPAAQFRSHGLTGGLRKVHQHDGGAGGMQTPRRCCAQAGRATGYQCYGVRNIHASTSS